MFQQPNTSNEATHKCKEDYKYERRLFYCYGTLGSTLRDIILVLCEQNRYCTGSGLIKKCNYWDLVLKGK